MSYKNITVVGATGNLGSLVLPHLLESDLEITVVKRAGSSSEPATGAKIAESDFSNESLTKVFEGQDVVISLLPINALEQQNQLIEAAITAGVKRFIPSEYGNDSTNPAVIQAVPFFEGKSKAIELLKTKEDSISWTALITGPFFDWGMPLGFQGLDPDTQTATIIDGGNVRFTTSTTAQIARAIISVLEHKDETRNKAVFVESHTITQNELLPVVAKVTGAKWTIVEQSSDELRAFSEKSFAEGNVMVGGGALMKALILGKDVSTDHHEVDGGIWNDRLGLPKASLEEEVREILGFAI
ncbi:hypothetical protein ACHAQA_009997 [Verticillium albo-atrum]